METKYQEALERAKKIYDSEFQTWGNYRYVVEQIFPELAESEDERIRKALIDGVSQIRCKGNITREQMVAYLEKQKVVDKEGMYYYLGGKFIYCGYPTLENPYDFAMSQQEKKEQKPAEWSDTNELVFQDICKHLNEEGYGGWVVLLNALHNGEFNQPKQEWSEEDEAFIDLLIGILNTEHPNGLFTMSPEQSAALKCELMPVNRIIDWIKSLRPQPQITEDDKHQAEVAIAFLKDYADKGYENAVCCIDWLKSKFYGK
jgi:hypothetical protein